MTPLTQYGRMAEKHWREHRPKMVRDLEAKGLLHAMLLEAEEKTKDEMADAAHGIDEAGIDGATGARPRRGKWCGRNTSCCPPEDLARRPSARKNRRRISTATASPTPTGWATADRSRSFSRTSGASKSLRTLDAEERPATDEEKAALVKYVGWGAMPQVFDVDSTDWRKEQIQLSEILSDEEHRSARATTLNAHYTAPTVIRAMYQAAAAVWLSQAGAFSNRPAASAISSASCPEKCSAARPSPALKLIR